MAFVNPTDQTAIFDGLSLKEIEQKYIYTSLNSAEHGFPMSNSVYYGHNPFTGQTEKMMATPVTNNQLYDSMDKAQSAIDNDEVLTIHVERYSAKIGLSIAADAIKDYEELKTADGTAVKLQFVPEYWRPNAVSKTSYQTKKFALSETEGVAAYKDVVDRFKNTGMADSWNNETDHRSFWGCSPSFYKNDYPNVSDDVLDVDDPDAVETDYAVKYFSYNGIKNGVAGSANAPAFDAGSDKFGTTPAYFYSRETTTFIDAINNVETGNPVASVASVVIVGKYLVDDATDAATFYVDHNTYYPSEAEAAAALIARQNLLYTYNDATNQYTKATDADYFNVEHPKAAVRGETPVAGRYVTLQLKGATADGLPALHFYDGDPLCRGRRDEPRRGEPPALAERPHDGGVQQRPRILQHPHPPPGLRPECRSDQAPRGGRQLHVGEHAPRRLRRSAQPRLHPQRQNHRGPRHRSALGRPADRAAEGCHQLLRFGQAQHPRMEHRADAGGRTLTLPRCRRMTQR